MNSETSNTLNTNVDNPSYDTSNDNWSVPNTFENRGINISEDQTHPINIESGDLSFRNSFRINYVNNTHEITFNTTNNNHDYRDDQDYRDDHDDPYLVFKLASLEEENKILKEKLEKLGDIILDLKNQIQILAKQKLTVNFGN